MFARLTGKGRRPCVRAEALQAQEMRPEGGKARPEAADGMVVSFPLKRRPGECRDGVGLRERVRKDTLTLRMQPTRGTPEPSACAAGRPAASRRRAFAFSHPFALPAEGARGESFPPENSSLSPGGVRCPACLFCLFCLCVSRVFCLPGS